MASCEARLLRQKVISGPFTAKEIAEGALRDHLTQEDYDAPLKVFTYNFNIFFTNHLRFARKLLQNTSLLTHHL